MRRSLLIYGLSMAALIAILKSLEYKYIIKDFTLEFYLGLVGVFFTAIGLWAGIKLTAGKEKVVHIPASVPPPDPETAMRKLGLSQREYEVLSLMAQGLSNQEIADKLFVSLSTIKTHSAKIFMKLDVKRRTQAVQKAKEAGAI